MSFAEAFARPALSLDASRQSWPERNSHATIAVPWPIVRVTGSNRVPADVLVYTSEEWESLARRSRFYETVMREAVWVWTRRDPVTGSSPPNR